MLAVVARHRGQDHRTQDPVELQVDPSLPADGEKGDDGREEDDGGDELEVVEGDPGSFLVAHEVGVVEEHVDCACVRREVPAAMQRKLLMM